MSGADNIVFNTREKAISQDINDVQAMEARTLATLLRFWTMGRISGLGAGVDTETVNPVINGMQVIPNGTNVAIQPGFILQDSPSISPAPGALDSSYRITLNFASVSPTAVAPSPVSNTYYLLEAQMQEVTTLSESRAVLNTVSGNFVSTSVPKRRERKLLTQWTAGTATDYPAPTGGDWVVLAGVFRPASGGAVLQSHIQDMRLQPDLLVGEGHFEQSTRPLINRLSVTNANDTAVKLSADARLWVGAPHNRGLALHLRNAFAVSPAGMDLSSGPDALLRDPTTTFAADTWYYVYLTHWKGLAPRTYTAGIVSRGVPVVSHVVPDVLSSSNSAALNLPPPFANSSIPTGEGRCVGLLRRNGANNGWRQMEGADRIRMGGLNGPALVSTGTFPGVMSVAASQLPRARLLRIGMNMAINISSAFGANGFLSMQVFRTPAASVLGYNSDRIPCPGADTTTRWDLSVEVPFDGAGLDFELTGVNGTIGAGGTFNAYLQGFTF